MRTFLPFRLTLAFVATLVLSFAFFRHDPPAEAKPTRMVTLEVGGMFCQDCVHKVSGALGSVPGVRTVRVDLASQRAYVGCDRGVADSTLTAAVRHAGPEYLGLIVAR